MQDPSHQQQLQDQDWRLTLVRRLMLTSAADSAAASLLLPAAAHPLLLLLLLDEPGSSSPGSSVPLRACSACLTASFSASFTGVPAGIRPAPGGTARDSKQERFMQHACVNS
jgi:hypothetical protein